MDLYILDANYRKTAYIEAYDSLIWALRYTDCGDFELHLDAEMELAQALYSGTYIVDLANNTGMVIEDYDFDTDSETGATVVFTGRSFESILDRRIVWGKKTVSGKIQTIISGLLSENVINPTDSDRRISNYVFQSSSDSRLDDCVIDSDSPLELNGDNLLDTVKYLCEQFEVGFRVVLNSSNQFVFSLYCGDILDGTNGTQKILFSPEFDNLLNTRYFHSEKEYKNVTLVASTVECQAEQTNDDDDANASTVITADTKSFVPYSLSNGRKMAVKFHKKVDAGATLNINGTGAKPIYYKKNGSYVAIEDKVIQGGNVVIVAYNSTGTGRYDVVSLKSDTERIEEQLEQTVSFESGSSIQGLNRREIFTDASGIETDENTTLSKYYASMRSMGNDTLRENKVINEFDGQTLPDITYQYNLDYKLGDVVIVSNEFGISGPARITEYVTTVDETGEAACPTFSSVPE